MPKRSGLALAAAVALIALAAGAWQLRPAAGVDPRAAAPAPDAVDSGRSAAVSKYPILIPGGDEVLAGHVQFRLVGARLDRHQDAADGRPETLALRVTVRATELSNIDTRITAENVRLLASGQHFSPQKPFNTQLYASQSTDLNDMLFLVPASLATASLQLGTTNGSSALLVLPLSR